MLAHRTRRLPKLVPGNRLWTVLLEHLRQGLSPAQIACALARMDPPDRLCSETIYTNFDAMPGGNSAPACSVCCATGAMPEDLRQTSQAGR